MEALKKPITTTLDIGYYSPFELKFWMGNFEVKAFHWGSTLSEPPMNLYLTLKKTYEEQMAMGSELKKSLTLKIEPSTLQNIKDCFTVALNWLTPEGKEGLYYTLDDTLKLNTEYANLAVSFVDSQASVQTGIRISPSIAEVGIAKFAPGLAVYINRYENGVIVTEADFRKLANTIINFNVIEYATHVLNMVQFAASTGRVTDMPKK